MAADNASSLSDLLPDPILSRTTALTHSPDPSADSPDDLPSSDLQPIDLQPIDSAEGDDAPVNHLNWRVGKDIVRRIDQFLVDRVGYLSRNEVQRVIKEGLVKVNGRVIKSSYHPRLDDMIEMAAPPERIATILPEPIPLDIVYEDDHLLALNKQANLVIHPARGVWTGTLVNGLVHYGQKYGSQFSTVNGNWRPGILHRLDRNTTGIMLVAKSDEAHWRVARQFENRTIQKTYIAVTHGIPSLRADRIDMPIGRDRYVREKQAVRKVEAGGKIATTDYEVLETIETPAGTPAFSFEQSAHPNDKHYATPAGRFSLIRLHPKTGRTHQLRVHLSHLGYPIVGDHMYGGQSVVTQAAELHHGSDSQRAAEPHSAAAQSADDAPAGAAPPAAAFCFARQALHAHRITFTHPVTLNELTLEAPLPPDIMALLNLLRAASGVVGP